MNQEKLSEAGDRRDVNHQTYLLRLWRAGSDQPAPWRASLENTRTGERFGFAVLEQLFVFLMEQIERVDRAAQGSPEARRSTVDDD